MARMPLLLQCLMSLSVVAMAIPAYSDFDLKAQSDYYRQRYRLEDPYAKLVNNRGESADGNDSLYGVRNFRAVLHGVYYRGGANNMYNKHGKRDNQNPLPEIGLNNLCREEFGESIYLYSTNFETAPKRVACQGLGSGQAQTLIYDQISAFTAGNERMLLLRIYDHIKGVRPGPLYAHCWNGWHASGFIAALALKQFCGWSGEEARAYWIQNTDGNSSGYESIEKRIRGFAPIRELMINPAEANLICP